MNKKWLIAGGVISALFLALYFGSPYWAVHKFQAAIQSGDADALETRVDFPVVRENLKSQLTAKLVEEYSNDPEMADNPFAGLGMLMAPSVVNSMVDAFVTPDGLARLVKTGNANIKSASNTVVTEQPKPDASYDYSGLDRFRVTLHAKDQTDAKVGLLLERRGLFSWKMIRVELPDDVLRK